MSIIEEIVRSKEIENINNRPVKWDYAKQLSTGITVRVEGFKKKGMIATCFWTDDVGRRVADIPIEDLIKIHIASGHTVKYRKGPKQDRLMKVRSINSGKVFSFWKSKNKIVSEWIPIEDLRWTNTKQFEIEDQVELITEQGIKRISAICEYHLFVTCVDADEDTFDSFLPPSLHYFDELIKY
jgi:hypothetical protein